jgi:Glyoxalase-like domain
MSNWASMSATGLGTHNALIRFGLDYVELLAIYDAEEARASGGPGQFMMDYLRARPSALLGFALASNHLEDEATFAGPPFAMERTRPTSNAWPGTASDSMAIPRAAWPACALLPAILRQPFASTTTNWDSP